MLITELKKMDSKKTKVYLDEEEAFFLYPSELYQYSIKEGDDLSEDVYQIILTETVLRRCKKKALDLLQRTDHTERDLSEKLKRTGYSDDIVEQTIDYIKSYHYLDDIRYAKQYITWKQDKKSRRQLEMELFRKGVSKEEIRIAMEETYRNEEEAIQIEIRKKTENITKLTRQEKEKIAASLYRKGFSQDNIRKYI